jgi:hypothetical protein
MEENSKPTPKEFNPKANYKWKNDSMFILNGEEFLAVLNGLRMTLNTPEAKRLFTAMQAAEVAENVLIRAVKNGIAEEQDTSKQEKPN